MILNFSSHKARGSSGVFSWKYHDAFRSRRRYFNVMRRMYLKFHVTCKSSDREELTRNLGKWLIDWKRYWGSLRFGWYTEMEKEKDSKNEWITRDEIKVLRISATKSKTFSNIAVFRIRYYGLPQYVTFGWMMIFELNENEGP